MTPKVYINPGHSDKDPGAVGFEVERQLNVKVSQYQREHLLNNYCVEVRMNPGTLSSLSAIADDANRWGADFFCANHFNAGGGDGWEGLVYSEKDKANGRIFEKHVKTAGQNSRGVKLRPDLAVLRLTRMPAILTEGAFVDNKKDIRDWNDDTELRKLGIAYAEATAEVMQLEKVGTFYHVQVGAFSQKAPAERKKKAMEAAGFTNVYLAVVDSKLWRVQLGNYPERTDAEQLLQKVKAAGFSGFVTRLSGQKVK